MNFFKSPGGWFSRAKAQCPSHISQTNIATMTNYFTEAAITSYGDIIVLSEDAIKALNTTELKVAMTAVDTKTTKATKAAVPQV